MVAETLKSDTNTKLLIEGNCDERGTEEYNRALGERRALAAREALAKLGIDPMRVFTRSYGKDKPAVDGHDETSWSQNRRDDFVLLHPKAGNYYLVGTPRCGVRTAQRAVPTADSHGPRSRGPFYLRTAAGAAFWPQPNNCFALMASKIWGGMSRASDSSPAWILASSSPE